MSLDFLNNRKLKNKNYIIKQAQNDIPFLLTDPSPSAVISDMTVVSTTIISKNNLVDCLPSPSQCQENKKNTLDSTQQNLLKNETKDSSELLNLITKILTASNNNLANNPPNIYHSLKKVILVLNKFNFNQI